MAKKSSIEKNNRRRKMAKRARGRRDRLKAIVMDKTKPMEERFAATLKLAEMPRNVIGDPHPQPLRSHGPAARVLPQAQAQPYRAARARFQGPDSGPCEVELVRRRACSSTIQSAI